MCAQSQYCETDEVFETPHNNPPKWALMLTAYFDESFQDGEGYVVMAGFIGDKDSWSQLEAEWKVGLGKKPSLHMKRLNWKYGSRYKKLLETLGAIPHACGLQPVFAAVRMTDYDIARSIPKKLRHGYYVSLAAAIVATMGNLPKGERIKFVFETQVVFARIREAAIHYISRMPEYRGRKNRKIIAGSESIPKCILLEPSDYLAYALLQTLIDKKSEKAQLCSPILKQGKKRIGGILSRNEVIKILPFDKKIPIL
jgi:hypothetical protein